MRPNFEEIDRQPTPMGEITLRRRVEPSLQVDVYEVKLGDESLMSSLFTVAEIELARLALAAVEGDQLDVVVGGLGLGYTAAAVLDDPRVRSMRVVEAVPQVIAWHERGALPLGSRLTGDPRCRLIEADFFAAVAATGSFDDAGPALSHVIAVDIDHSPRHQLHPSHAAFYRTEGLRKLGRLLHPGGVFALWSDDPPDAEFVAAAEGAFEKCEAHVVRFPNFYTEAESANTVYVASGPRA